jgi:hypothetical protein
LVHYIQELDRMPRMLIIETLNAAPVQGGGGVLNVTLKLDTFVREDGGALPAIPGSPEASGVAGRDVAASRPQTAGN